MEQETLADYLLILADSSLILGQRNSEWCGHGPVLEQDIALTNIALDLIGEARNLYQYAADLKGQGNTEDSLAYLRNERQFRNLLLCEFPNTDWAYTITRQFFYDSFHCLLLRSLLESKDSRLSEIARKTLKEATYHLRWSSEWVIRLGDGTELSRSKMQDAVNDLWEYTGEMFIPVDAETAAADAGVGPHLTKLEAEWKNQVSAVLKEATLSHPENAFMQTGGKKGIHTEKLGFILAEMQILQRSYPGANW